MDQWLATDHELDLFHRELDGFVPDRVFDAHVHLYSQDHLPEEDVLPVMRRGPSVVGADVFLRYIDGITPGRKTAALCFPYPQPGVDFEAAHDFLADELTMLTGSRGQMLVKPSLDPEHIREAVRARGFVGLKCYSCFSSHDPKNESPIEKFLPEEHVRVANEEGLTITLHIVRSRALADPANQATIRRYAERYPNMKLILAHAGRGFNPHHTIEGLPSLTGLDNVYFDTGVVQDSGAFEAIIDTMGHTRLLWGSDFPLSQDRGRGVAVGDEYLWITPKMLSALTEEDANASGPTGKPTLVMQGYESLRSLKLAATHMRLTDPQVEDIFYGNAESLYGL